MPWLCEIFPRLWRRVSFHHKYAAPWRKLVKNPTFISKVSSTRHRPPPRRVLLLFRFSFWFYNKILLTLKILDCAAKPSAVFMQIGNILLLYLIWYYTFIVLRLSMCTNIGSSVHITYICQSQSGKGKNTKKQKSDFHFYSAGTATILLSVLISNYKS